MKLAAHHDVKTTDSVAMRVHESGRCDGFHDVYGQNRDGTL